MTSSRITRFSEPDRAYRYVLWREWGKANADYVIFIGLNPSTADETEDDNTIRRCVGFAKSWGFGAVCVTNLFALRATRPTVMKAHHAPIGPKNNYWLREMIRGAKLVVAAWGVHGAHRNRHTDVAAKAKNLFCIGTTKNGSPRHPLYVKKNAKLEKFTFRDLSNREEMLDTIRGIQRGLDSMAAGQGEPARKVLDRIRAQHKIPRTTQ